MKHFFLHFQPLDTNEEMKIDFKSEKPTSYFIEVIKLDGYKMYQYIQSDYTYAMPIEELNTKNVKFKKLQREKKTWFGLSKKNSYGFIN